MDIVTCTSVQGCVPKPAKKSLPFLPRPVLKINPVLPWPVIMSGAESCWACQNMSHVSLSFVEEFPIWIKVQKAHTYQQQIKRDSVAFLFLGLWGEFEVIGCGRHSHISRQLFFVSVLSFPLYFKPECLEAKLVRRISTFQTFSSWDNFKRDFHIPQPALMLPQYQVVPAFVQIWSSL